MGHGARARKAPPLWLSPNCIYGIYGIYGVYGIYGIYMVYMVNMVYVWYIWYRQIYSIHIVYMYVTYIWYTHMVKVRPVTRTRACEGWEHGARSACAQAPPPLALSQQRPPGAIAATAA
jgi:hypothetical protein